MTPYYKDESVTVYAGACIEVMKHLPDNSVDAVCTDPPYGLEFMGKDWDAPWKATGAVLGHATERGGFQDSPNGGNPYSRARVEYGRGGAASLGFQAWCEMWATECLRVLKPGGHMLAFGGTRTHHRLACAIEDAGFEIRDSIAWLYASGFPKSLDVSKAIDKRPGIGQHPEFAAHLTERREAKGLTRQQVALVVVGTATGACWNWEHHQFPEAKWWPALRDLLDMDEAKWGPVIAEAERSRTGLSSYSARRSSNIGYGADLAAEGERFVTAPATDAARRWQGWGTALKPAHEPIVVARKPLAGTVASNVQQWGTGALNIDGCRVGTGEDKGVWPKTDRSASRNSMAGGPMRPDAETDRSVGRWPPNVLLDPTAATELDRQSGVVTSGVLAPHHKRTTDGGNGTTHGRMPGTIGESYGDAGGASRFFPVFRYEPKAPAHERPVVDGEAHPTVKPVDLMRWLVRLVCPPGGTVLDPFAGTGPTGEACVIEGFRAVLIERHTPYLPLIRARLTKPIALDLFGAGDYAPRPTATNTRQGETSAERRYTEKGGTRFAMKPGPRYDQPRPVPPVVPDADLFGGAS